MAVYLLMAAAGQGTRLGQERPKAWVEVHGHSLAWWAGHFLAAWDGWAGWVVAAPPDIDLPPDWRKLITACTWPVTVVPGGTERFHSVGNCWRVLVETQHPGDLDIVMIHDVARPLVPSDVIEALIVAIKGGASAAVPALPIPDTVKEVEGDTVVGTVDRTRLYRIQTPQAFTASVLAEVMARGRMFSPPPTDEATIIEDLDYGTVRIVPGSARLNKVTYADDLDWLTWKLEQHCAR